MPVLFKLVGTVNNKTLEIKKNVSGNMRLSDIHSLFEIFGMGIDDFEHIRFVANSETIKNNEKIYQVTDETNLVIFVFTANKDIKNKLGDVFSKNATNEEEKPSGESRPLVGTVNDSSTLTKLSKISEEVDPELTKSIEDKEVEKVPELSEEHINMMNEKTLKLFESSDFKNLIKIYYTNPDILKLFFNFVSHGDIVKMTIPKMEDSTDFKEKIQMIKGLGVDEKDEVIQDALQMFNGHLNLTLRLLLCKKANLFNN